MTPETRLLGAALRGAEQERDRILRAEFGGLLPMTLLPLAFTVAARRRFPPDVDRRAVSRFARRFVTDVPGGAGVAAREAEAALRGVTGETALLETTRLPELMYALTLALADELQLGDDDVDALLAEAERAAADALELAVPADPEPVPVQRHRRTGRRLLRDEELRPARAPRPPRPAPAVPPAGAPATRAGRHLRAYLVPSVTGPAVAEVTTDDRFLILRATLAEALPRYLPEDPEVAEFAALVGDARTVWPAELDLMKAEYLARLVLGEDVPMDGLTKRDVYQNGAALLQLIVVRWGRDDALVSALIAEAEAALTRQGKRLA